MSEEEAVQQLPNMPRDEELMLALATVNDPELHVPITEMGLIYGAVRKKGDKGDIAKITMTLTTIGCPLFDVIKYEVESVLQAIDGITKVEIELTFDPPWQEALLDIRTGKIQSWNDLQVHYLKVVKR